ncbi:MAG: regulatory particle non-ATPase [Pycnora praestabilis]|nr:MAG: regulatory particle non-ATPase [Pycnora praestabilis]
MAVTNDPKITEKSLLIRQELKEWEKGFAAANDGRKAGRDDIKQFPAIDAKYKEYHKLRDIISGKALSSLRKCKASAPQDVAAQTPYQHSKHARKSSKRHAPPALTPSKPIAHPAALDPYDSPTSIRKLFTPSKRNSIGPTPQKDGQVIGLFDVLPGDTPSRSTKQRTALEGMLPNVQMTPSKRDLPNGTIPIEEIDGSIGSRSRTPTSNGQRFLTPSKRKRDDAPEAGGPGGNPSSVSKLQFSTPAFLRRDSQRFSTTNPGEGEGGDISPVAFRLPMKPPVRGLSSMLAGLRRMEDERLDEEMDLMREMEMEGGEALMASFKAKVPSLLVEDSQVLVIPGPDGFASEDNDEDESEGDKGAGLGRDGKPLKVWKKKGQKRTTRRVIMRPVRSRPKPFDTAPIIGDSDDDNDDNVAETQVATTAVPEPPRYTMPTKSTESGDEFDTDSDVSDHSASSDHTRNKSNKPTTNSSITDDSNPPRGKAPRAPPPPEPSSSSSCSTKAQNAGAHPAPAKQQQQQQQQQAAAAAKKKINSQAHSHLNFRRLKIKSKNGKGRGGGGGRFGGRGRR